LERRVYYFISRFLSKVCTEQILRENRMTTYTIMELAYF